MPRLQASELWEAFNRNSLLPLLLRACRDLQSAKNELRWLQEHAISLSRKSSSLSVHEQSRETRDCLYRFCLRRSRGEPLQYILGTQPFGPLEILCEKGVLIPRPETESIVTLLAKQINDQCRRFPSDKPLKVLDLCSGSGCISLLLHALLQKKKVLKAETNGLLDINAGRFSDVNILGVDFSTNTVPLAQRNLRHSVESGHLSESSQGSIEFVHGDVCNDEGLSQTFSDHGYVNFDILVANPPYISPQGFARETTRSVRNYEPKLALVPTQSTNNVIDASSQAQIPDHTPPGDEFYPHIIRIAQKVNAKALLMEIGHSDQADRVSQRILSAGDGGDPAAQWLQTEIWHDQLSDEISPTTTTRDTHHHEVESMSSPDIASIRNRGKGNARAVFALRRTDGDNG